MTRNVRWSLALLICACYTTTEPIPGGAIPLIPPPRYETWWQEVEDCSGIQSSFREVSWYYVPGAATFTVGTDSNVSGYWQPYHHSITLAGGRIDDPDLVRHEMLHAIVKAKGHPAEYFSQKCGALVTPPSDGS
jgi:hypothetical protein